MSRRDNNQPPRRFTDKKGIVWTYFGMGEFNWVYETPNTEKLFSDDAPYSGPSVFKINKRSFLQGRPEEGASEGVFNSAMIDAPQRSVRITTEVNPSLPSGSVRQYLCEFDDISFTGWSMPFIKGTKPTDKEIARTLRKIYRETGRIVVDAVSPGNFIKMPDEVIDGEVIDGEVICVDSALGLRRNSFVSSQYRDQYESQYIERWEHGEATNTVYPQTAFCLRVLTDLDASEFGKRGWENDETRRREFPEVYRQFAALKSLSKVSVAASVRSPTPSTFRKVKLKQPNSEERLSNNISSGSEASAPSLSVHPKVPAFPAVTTFRKVKLNKQAARHPERSDNPRPVEPVVTETASTLLPDSSRASCRSEGSKNLQDIWLEAQARGVHQVDSKDFREAWDLARRCDKANKKVLINLIYLIEKGILPLRIKGKTERTPFDNACEFAEQAKQLEDLLIGESNVVVKAKSVFDEVMILANNPKVELPVLTDALKETKELLSFSKNKLKPYGNNLGKKGNEDILKTYRKKAKAISGNRSWGKRLGGAMLALLGAVIVVISVVAMIKSCGLLAPLGIHGVKFGKGLLMGGLGIGVGKAKLLTGSAAMWKSKRRGASKAMMKFADAADPTKPSTETRTPHRQTSVAPVVS